jgi:hypothetical protein
LAQVNKAQWQHNERPVGQFVSDRLCSRCRNRELGLSIQIIRAQITVRTVMQLLQWGCLGRESKGRK